MTCGIYSITNKKTGKMYIGQSIHIERRFKEHIYYGNNSMYIDRSIRKYGEDAFDFNILLECEESELSDEEQKFIKLYGTYKNGYNLTWGGEVAISKSPEIRKKISEANKGRKMSEEARKKMSESRKGKCVGKDHPQYGKPRSEETRRKISETLTGRHLPEETKKKMSESQKGKKMSEECYKKTIKRLKENHPSLGRHQSLDEQINRSRGRTTSGIFRVCKNKDYTSKQGFLWQYNYYDGDKRKTIRRVDINDLKEAVLVKGLEWVVIDEYKARECGLI